MLNRVQLIGSLGADVEIRNTTGGIVVGNMRIATTERVKKGEQWEDHTEWHRVTVFGKKAEICAKFLSKGSRCFIEGRLRTTRYTKDGVEKYTTDIIADDVKFLNARDKVQSKDAEDEVPF